MPTSSSSVISLAVLAHQHAEHVFTGVELRPPDQRLHVSPAGTAQLHPLRRSGSTGPAGGRCGAWNSVAVLVRHPEQFADHQRRDRQRERLHEVGRAARGRHRVEVLRRRSRRSAAPAAASGAR